MVLSPLTGSRNVAIVEKIKVADIKKLYSRNLGLKNLNEFNGCEEITLYRCLDSDLIFFYPQITGSHVFYEQLQSFNWYYLDDKSEYLFAENFVKLGNTVLDVGCGRGQFGNRVVSKAHFTGLEFNDEAIKKATAKGLNVIKQSIEKHSQAHSGFYDVVTAFQVLEHIGSLKSFIEACLKVVKPGGKLIFSVPSYDSLVSLQSNNTLNLPPHHVSWWTDECLKNLSSLFDMELEAIHHEALDKEHKKWFGFLLASEALKKSFHYKKTRKTIDFSLKLRIIHGMAGKIAPFISKGLTDSKLTPFGQSVTAVYTKR